MMTLYFDVLAQNCSCLRIVSYFSSKMMTLYFDVLAQNYRCLRKVSYFSRKIGIWQGCGFWGSAIWRLCILTFWLKTTVVCEKFHILAVKQGLGKIALVADFEDHATLYFDVLSQNYSCLRIVSYFSSKIGIGRNSTGFIF